MKVLFCIAFISALGACTWVNENPQSQSVAITAADSISQCRRVGTINASTKHKIVFNRSKKKVLSELQALARNEALKIQANTISPVSAPVEGKQRYLAFACPR